MLKEKALAAGGLYVLATERHESRRIDNQLRGRSGRQGDPGRSKFYLSLQDDLMRIFGSERMDGMLQKLGLKDGEAIVHPWINKALERAQKKVEARNFDIRKNLLKYDDVLNDQRKVIFEQRIEMMDSEDLSEIMTDMRHEAIDMIVEKHIPERAYAEQWDAAGLKASIAEILNLDIPVEEWIAEEGIAEDDVRQRLIELSDKAAAERQNASGRKSPPMSSARSCCRRLTACGASISSTSTTCAQLSVPRLCPARSAAGIQVGSLRAFPVPAQQHAPGRDQQHVARRDRAGATAAGIAADAGASYRRLHRRR